MYKWDWYISLNERNSEVSKSISQDSMLKTQWSSRSNTIYTYSGIVARRAPFSQELRTRYKLAEI